jgi:hypothetical protein
MSDLPTRKRELLLESDLNRKVLQVEFGQWQLQAARWQTGLGRAQGLWRVVSPLARIFLARKGGSLARSLWNSIARRF